MMKQRCFAAVLALTMLVACPVCAEDDTAIVMTLSAYINEEAPVPDVPACERVDSAYFEGAAFIGDSMGDGLAIHELMPGLQLLARVGLSPRSAMTEEIFKNGDVSVTLVEKLTVLQPDAVYLWLGSNGLVAMGVDQIILDYDQLLNQLLEALPNTPFYLLEVTPVREVEQAQYADLRNERIDAFNHELYEMAKRHNVYMLPVNALLQNEEGVLDEAYAAKDGTHLQRAAYEVLADFMYTHVLPQTGVKVD